MAGFACPSCNAEFETQEKLEDHKQKAHSGESQPGQRSEQTPTRGQDKKS